MKRTHAARAPRKGMVLMEVLIALTIFSVVTLGLVIALDQSFGAARERNTAEAAQRGLRNELALLQASPVAPGQRDLPDDGSGLHFRVSVAAEPMIDQHKQPLPGLFRTTVTASWTEAGHHESRQVSELVYRP